MKYIIIAIIIVVASFWALSKNNNSDHSSRLTNDDVNNFLSGVSTTKAKATIKLYATSWCGYCAKTRQFLKKNKLNYIEYDIEKDPIARKRFKELNGKGVPLIEANNLIIRGYSDYQLKKLAADGRYKL